MKFFAALAPTFIRTAAFVLAAGSACRLAADVTCPAVIGDHMVLQRDLATPLWGTAAAGEAVRVEFAGQTLATTAGADGKWLVRFAPLSASAEPRTLTVQGKNTLTFHDVLVGEVWFCSGQSNMEKPLGQQRGQKPTDNAEAEIAAANFPLVRLYQVARNGKPEAGDLNYKWLACSPQNVDQMHFSAAAYFFGRELHRELRVPVGLIHSSYGGTRIEVWTPPEGFARAPELAAYGAAAAAQAKIEGIVPSSLFRSMVEPLLPFATRGAIWYQGETNLMNVESDVYAVKLKALVESWRARWGLEPWAFYYVQIAPFLYSPRKNAHPVSAEALPRFWEVQTKALSLIPNSGMIVTTDIAGDVRDIHPTNKRDVGLRLAKLALHDTYGRKEIETSGPLLAGAKTVGATIELTFTHAAGLRSRDSQPLNSFTIAGADRKFVPAAAEIRGEQIVVSAAGVTAPVAVRFAWAEDATPNLSNAVGLPARPFRTDEWPVEISRPVALADTLAAPLPKVVEPTIPETAVKLTDFGAVGDGLTMNTKAFADAIGAIVAKGGGRVNVPSGIWLTGPIVLQSKVELHLERGALIQFSGKFSDYPIVETTWEGQNAPRAQSPISARNAEHLAITGDGIIDGAGQAWRPVKKDKLTAKQWDELVASGGVLDEGKRIWYPSAASLAGQRGPKENTPAAWAAIHDALRPVMVSLVECRYVKLEGVTFQNSPAWNLHPSLCDDVTVRRVTVRNPWFAQNGDGIDPESCRNVLIEQSTFDVGDDAICLKSGKDAEGRKRGRPTENVTVRECTVFHAHGGFVIGSEMSGGVRNIRVSDCTFLGTDVGLRFKSGRGRGGVVEDVLVERVRMSDIPGEAILFDLFYTGRPKGDAAAVVPPVTEATPAFRRILMRDIVVDGAERVALMQGLPEMPISDIRLENASLQGDAGALIADAEGISFEKVQIHVAHSPAVEIRQAKKVSLAATTADGAAKGPLVKITGEHTADIHLAPGLASAATEIGHEVPAGAVRRE